MITDEERREVARRLRELRATAPGFTSVGHGYLWSLLWAVSGGELGESNRCDWFERMCSRLADLIEPIERACYYYDAETNHCRCYDTRLVDRDALLALADEMDERSRWVCVGDAIHAKACARRIREALGVKL